MTPFDRHDRESRSEGPSRQVRRLPVVGGDARLLEDARRAYKGFGPNGGVAEAKARLGSRRLSESLPERADVILLLRSDALGELPQLPPQLSAFTRVAVEGGLEVFEQERKVEDLAIYGRRGLGTRRGLRGVQGGAAECGRARGRQADEAEARLRESGRLTRHRPVWVEHAASLRP